MKWCAARARWLAPVVAVLFARSDSIYKTMRGCDVYDIDRDARTYTGKLPVVAHPPCRAWGALRALAKPRPDEKELAIFAVATIRRVGGVLEHPAHSTLWKAAGLPYPGAGTDEWGGFTIPLQQNWFGHRAAKATWVYVCGATMDDLPRPCYVLGEATHVIAQSRARGPEGKRLVKGMPGWRPEVTRREREATPPAFAEWLKVLASRCRPPVRKP